MGYISDASSSVADFSKCVISFLARVPSASTTGAAFLQFGNTTDGPSEISVSSATLVGNIYGVYEGYTFTQGVNTSNPVTAYVSLHGSSTLTFSYDAWHRVIISLDLGGAEFAWVGPTFDDFTVTSNSFRRWISIDDTDYSTTSFGDPGGVAQTGPAGSFFPGFLTATGIGQDDLNQSYPAFNIACSGLELALPVLAASAGAGDNNIVQLADFMMWTGVSLDTSVTANRRLFIDAVGDQVNPSTAIASLGTPVYDLRGPSSGIATNQGSAGNLTKTGTVTDYTPGP